MASFKTAVRMSLEIRGQYYKDVYTSRQTYKLVLKYEKML
jgi:hypothetical protein